MKQTHDSCDDYKFPVTANETLSEMTAIFYVVTIIISVIGPYFSRSIDTCVKKTGKSTSTDSTSLLK